MRDGETEDASSVAVPASHQEEIFWPELWMEENQTLIGKKSILNMNTPMGYKQKDKHKL